MITDGEYIDALAIVKNYLKQTEDNYLVQIEPIEPPIYLRHIDLNIRVINCLRRTDIETLADLLNITKKELMEIRNFGEKSLNEVLEYLDEQGLELKHK